MFSDVVLWHNIYVDSVSTLQMVSYDYPLQVENTKDMTLPTDTTRLYFCGGDEANLFTCNHQRDGPRSILCNNSHENIRILLINGRMVPVFVQSNQLMVVWCQHRTVCLCRVFQLR